VIQVESDGVDWQNHVMNKDFREAINADNYPYILLELKEFTLRDPVNKNPAQREIPSGIAITMAG
jgi:hypothetical protein